MSHQQQSQARIDELGSSHRLVRWGKVIALSIFAFMALIAGLVLRAQIHHHDQIAARVREANRFKMTSVREHIEEYLNNVYSTLLFISLDKEVGRMTRNSYGYIESIFAHQQKINHLSEIYVVERRFDGTRAPFMVFNQGVEKHGPEEDEYRTLVEQIERFTAAPALPAQISREVRLCLPAPGEDQGRGVVFAVPIRPAGELVGAVAGMISTRQIAAVLEHGNFHNMVILASENGALFSCEDLPEETRAWFAGQFRQKGVAGFFAAAPPIFAVGQWESLWTPIAITSDQRWWLVFQYDLGGLLRLGGLGRHIELWGSAGGLLLTGAALAVLVLVMRRRLEEQAWHHAEHEQAAEQIRNSLQEKEALLKETNHRVKNNLQVVASLLDLQSRHTEDQQTRDILQTSVNRVKSMALIHERLYRSRDLARINAVEYLQRLAVDVFQSYQTQSTRVALNVNVDNVYLEATTAVHCGLIVNELVSNALKHAFPDGRQGELCIDLHQDERDWVVLAVRDDGVGFPPGMDFRTTRSLGLQLVNTLVEKQLKGSLELGHQGGTQVRIAFPLPV